MSLDYPLMIPGANSASDPVNVTAPYDDAHIATVATGDSSAIDKALATAERLYKDRHGWLAVYKRVEILEKTAEIIAARAEELAVEAAREGGKPLIDSRVEVDRAIDGVKLCIEALRTQHGSEIPMNVTPSSANRIAFTSHEPVGPVVSVSAFNHPLNLIIHQVAPAVAAGCPVIVKPAAITALSCMHFVAILHEAGLPEEWCQAVVPAGREQSEALVVDPRVAFFSFIGSAGVGWSLRSKLAPGTRCALEHGGVAPVIIAADADLDDVLPVLTKGGFYHAGQVCVSVQRIFADSSIAREVAERIAGLADKLVIGDPTSETTEVGPLIRHAEVNRVEEWVAEAADSGGEVLCGGEKLSPSCYKCTVLYDPPGDVRVSTNEIFGPVVCVYPFDDIDEAIARANSLPVAFQAAVCTRDIDTALHVYRHIDASAVMVNDHTAFRVDWMPFAGLRQSGHGVGGIHHSLHDMQIEKMMVMRSKSL